MGTLSCPQSGSGCQWQGLLMSEPLDLERTSIVPRVTEPDRDLNTGFSLSFLSVIEMGSHYAVLAGPELVETSLASHTCLSLPPGIPGLSCALPHLA